MLAFHVLCAHVSAQGLSALAEQIILAFMAALLSPEDAPKDGRPVLLWARLKSAPAEKGAASYPIVGRWDNWQWQAAPDLLKQCGADPDLLDRASARA